jgi:hypothetical protein
VEDSVVAAAIALLESGLAADTVDVTFGGKVLTILDAGSCLESMKVSIGAPKHSGSGGWGSALAVSAEVRYWANTQNQLPTIACPHDGEPLTQTNPEGIEHCRYDGYTKE